MGTVFEAFLAGDDEEHLEAVATAVLERSPAGVRVTVRDQGKGFDPAPFLRVEPTRLFDTHGRGILMAKAMSFDELEYRDGGREVVATMMGR